MVEQQFCRIGSTGIALFNYHGEKHDKSTVQNVADFHNKQCATYSRETVNSSHPSTIVLANEQEYLSPHSDKSDSKSRNSIMLLEPHVRLSVIQQFKLLRQDKPVYTCCICDRSLFKKGVKNFFPLRYGIPFETQSFYTWLSN